MFQLSVTRSKFVVMLVDRLRGWHSRLARNNGSVRIVVPLANAGHNSAVSHSAIGFPPDLLLIG